MAGIIGRLAAGVGDGTGPEETRPEAVVVAEGELEVSRIQTHRRGQPVTIKLMRKRGTPVELDASYGNAGHAAADASIERHKNWLARSPENKVKLPRVKTGDPVFDQKFSVHGDAPLADTDLGDGWRGSKATVSRSGAAAPRATSCRTRRTRPGVERSGRGRGVGGFDRRDVDMLADIVDATMPAAADCTGVRRIRTALTAAVQASAWAAARCLVGNRRCHGGVGRDGWLLSSCTWRARRRVRAARRCREVLLYAPPPARLPAARWPLPRPNSADENRARC